MPFAGIHVLVIHDDQRERQFVRDALECWGAIVTATTADGAARVGLIADVIVCDLETMEDAGETVVERLWRAHIEHARRVPTVTLVPRERPLAGSALEADLYRRLTKPLDASELQMTVWQLTRTPAPTEPRPGGEADLPPGGSG
jgi:CheY-like chemotaxis protein